MVIRITNPRPATWYSNKKDWQYEVEEDGTNTNGAKWYLVSETKNHLFRLHIAYHDCEIVEN